LDNDEYRMREYIKSEMEQGRVESPRECVCVWGICLGYSASRENKGKHTHTHENILYP
jgi:hypothetical protein